MDGCKECLGGMTDRRCTACGEGDRCLGYALMGGEQHSQHSLHKEPQGKGPVLLFFSFLFFFFFFWCRGWGGHHECALKPFSFSGLPKGIIEYMPQIDSQGGALAGGEHGGVSGI